MIMFNSALVVQTASVYLS